MDVYMKPIKIGRNAWEYVRNIQPICSNLGHSWQGFFLVDKKFPGTPNKTCLPCFCSFAKTVLDRNKLYKRRLKVRMTQFGLFCFA